MTLTPDEVRRLTLRAQWFLSAYSWHRSLAVVAALLRLVVAVQLYTISVLALSHELVAYRGSVPPAAIEQAYYATKLVAFEYSAHAPACCLTLSASRWP